MNLTLPTNTDLQNELQSISTKLMELSNRDTHLADIGIIANTICIELKNFSERTIKRHYEVLENKFGSVE